MVVARPLVILMGLFALLPAVLVAALQPTNFASDTLMYWVFVVIAIEAVMGVGCLIAGVWGPLARWFGGRPD